MATPARPDVPTWPRRDVPTLALMPRRPDPAAAVAVLAVALAVVYVLNILRP